MSSVENPKSREHIGDEFVTHSRRREGRGPRSDYPPFPDNSEEEEEAHREAEQRAEYPPFPPSSEEEEEAHKEAERKADHEAERMTGDECERPEGSGKEPVDPDTSFMQVISNLVISQ